MPCSAADLAPFRPCFTIVGKLKRAQRRKRSPWSSRGQAAAIMTGAAAPSGADAVVMVEYTSRRGDRVEIGRGVAAGDNIVPAGSEAKRGERLLTCGHAGSITPVLLWRRRWGRRHLLVYRKPQVAVLATGDEVVDIDAPPGPESDSQFQQLFAGGADPGGGRGAGDLANCSR